MALPPIPLPRYMRPGGYPAAPALNPYARKAGPLGKLFGLEGNEWYDALRPLIQDVGYGLAKGTDIGDAFSIAGQRSAEMAPYRQEEQQRQSDLQKAIERAQRTAAGIRNMAGDNPEMLALADAIENQEIDAGQGFFAGIEMQGELKQTAEARRKAQANAQFIKDPILQAAVANETLTLKDAMEFSRQRSYRPLTPEEAASYGLPSPAGYQVNGEGNIDAIGGGNTTIQMPAGETAYDKAVGEGFGKQYLGLQEGAQKGVRTLTTLDMMSQAVEDPSFYSGTLAEPVVLGLKRAAAAIGIDPSGVTSMETFNALSKQAALDVMGGSLGTGFSNADRDFVIQQVPNLQNTPEGNKQLIEIQKALAHRQIEISQLADEYAKTHGGRIDGQFGQALAAWAEQNPLFVGGGQQGGFGGSATSLPDPMGFR